MTNEEGKTAGRPEAKHQELPALTPWNGKKVPAKVLPKGGGAAVTIKNVPEPIAKLLAKFGGSRLKAAQAMGYSTASGLSEMITGDKKFNEKYQNAVHAAMHGVSPRAVEAAAQGVDEDEYTLGIAIVFMPAASFDRINEIATGILGAKLSFKKNTKQGWLMIYKFPVRDKMRQFKFLAGKDANQIVCP